MARLSFSLLLFGALNYVVGSIAAATCAPKVKNEGQTVGVMKDIGGIQTYLSYPPSNRTENAILFITDIYGLPQTASLLLADSMASAGYFVVAPDIFAGDIPSPSTPLNFTAWGPKHPPSLADGILEKTIKSMKGEMGVKRLGVVGYCYGGRFAVRLLAKGGEGVDGAFVAHPTMLEAGEIEVAMGPLSIAAAETDPQFPAPKRREAEDILQKKSIPYQLTLYAGAEHGFAVRAPDGKDRRKVFAKQGSFMQAVNWFDEWVRV